MDFVYKQIWSDEEIKKHKQETNRKIINAFGQGLLETETEAAKELLWFIVSVYHSAHEKDPETAYEVGSILCRCIGYSDENPEEEISKEFRTLYEKYLLDGDDGDAENA